VGLNRVYDVYIVCTFSGVDPTDPVGLSRALDTNCIYDIHVGLNRNYDVYISGLPLPTPVGVTRAFDTRTVYDIHVGLNRVYDVYIVCTVPGVDPTLYHVWWFKEWNYGTFAEGATYIRLGGHHVGHRRTF